MSNTSLHSNDISAASKDALYVRPLRILVATAVALILNLSALWIGAAIGASLITSAPEPINAISVTVATVAPLLLMGAVVWGLTRRYPLRRLAGWVGLIFALVSSIGSFAFSVDTATALTLAAMHFVTGLAWFIALMPWVKTPVAR
jgi:hypothetical protein